MKTVLFKFADDLDRDMFLKAVRVMGQTALLPNSPAHSETFGNMILDALDRISLDPPVKADQERTVSLFVSGRKLKEGSLADMDKMFGQECSAHHGSVELKELRSGEWISIRKRGKTTV